MRLGVVAMLVVPVVASAGDYPTAADEKDKLCEVIGEAPNLSVPPRDRLWFKENCLCASAGCGALGSQRFTARTAAWQRDAERRVAAAVAAEAQRKKAAKRRAEGSLPALRRAYWACDADPSMKGCRGPAGALEAACRAVGIRVDPDSLGDDDCYRQD